MSQALSFRIENYIEIILLIVIVLALSPLLGRLMARVFERGFWGESALFLFLGIHNHKAMTAGEYLRALLWFHLLGLGVLFFILVSQRFLPLNPENLPGMPWAQALNIAVSFVTHTNWQIYNGEEVLSPGSQMWGLGVQNFLSAATSLSLLIVLARAIRSKTTDLLGNFWVDLVRSMVAILIPLSLVWSLILSSQGVVQSFSPPRFIETLEGDTQKIVVGPVASQTAIKLIGVNGGGYYGANSAHPFENPTPLSNFVSLIALLLVPVSCVFAFGRLSGQRRHARSLFVTASTVLMGTLAIGLWAQFQLNTSLADLSFMEGVETRFGVTTSSLWGILTTATANGSSNAALSSMAPLAGFGMIFNLITGSVGFGGAGTGVVTLVFYSMLTVFIAGLMVGRTPEYLGKKLSASEIVWASVGVLGPSLVILLLASITCVLPAALMAVGNPGPHGLSEVLYAYASTANNNGSSFGGLSGTNPWILWFTTLAMLVGRACAVVPCIVLAGNLSRQRITPPSEGTFPTHGLVFGVLLVGLIVTIGALTFFPVLVLGPIVEHLLMLEGRLF